MSSLALEIDRAMQRLDPPKASQLERLLRDGLALAFADEVPPPSPFPPSQHEAWLERLEALRHSVGAGGAGPTTEAIIEDLRSERD